MTGQSVGVFAFVIDPDGGRGGGIATRIVRPGARRHGGRIPRRTKTDGCSGDSLTRDHGNGGVGAGLDFCGTTTLGAVERY